MFDIYVYCQQPSYLMEFKYSFYFMPVHSFTLMEFLQLWLLNLQGLVISVHMSFLQIKRK